MRRPAHPVSGRSLMPSVGDFWAPESLEELAEAQGVGVVESMESLQDNTVSEEDADAFVAALEL